MPQAWVSVTGATILERSHTEKSSVGFGDGSVSSLSHLCFAVDALQISFGGLIPMWAEPPEMPGCS